MNKAYLEILGAILFVTGTTFFLYTQLADVTLFWDRQFVWSIALLICWAVVSAGYFHQGLIVRANHSAANVSLVLQCTVFVVQCILFVKGIYYKDFSLIFGAVMVNCGVIFSLYQIITTRMKNKA